MLEFRTMRELKEKVAKAPKPKVVVYFGAHEPVEPTTDLVKRVAHEYGNEVLFIKHPPENTPLEWFRECRKKGLQLAGELLQGHIPDGDKGFFAAMPEEKRKATGKILDDLFNDRLGRQYHASISRRNAVAVDIQYRAIKVGVGWLKLFQELRRHWPEFVAHSDAREELSKMLPDAAIIDVHGTGKKGIEAPSVISQRDERGNNANVSVVEYSYLSSAIKRAGEDHDFLISMTTHVPLPKSTRDRDYIGVMDPAHAGERNAEYARHLKELIDKRLAR